MPDKIEKIKNSIIQHGTFNNRVYIMKLSADDAPYIINYIQELVKNNRYTKVFGKIPGSLKELFVNNGYKEEARIPDFFIGGEDLVFMSLFLDDERGVENGREKHEEVLEWGEF